MILTYVLSNQVHIHVEIVGDKAKLSTSHGVVTEKDLSPADDWWMVCRNLADWYAKGTNQVIVKSFFNV